MAPLVKLFHVQAYERIRTEDGYTDSWTKKGELRGYMYGANTRELMLAQQLGRTTTHTVAQQGKPQAAVGQRLVLPATTLPDGVTSVPARYLYIQGVNNEAEADIYTFYDLEERAE